MLTAEEKAFYEANGYLAYEGLLTHAEVDALLSRVEKIVEDPPPGVRMQTEPGIVRGEAEADSKLNSLRKIELLVENDDLFLSLARHPNILPRIQSILGEHVKMFRDALMMKPAHHGSEKPYHQDSAYWPIEPMNLCSIWIALNDATLENGCMRVIPGSHKQGVIEHKHARDFQIDESAVDVSQEVCVPLKKGGVLFFHSLTLHATSPNESPYPRRAMIVSYMSGDSRDTSPAGRQREYLVIC